MQICTKLLKEIASSPDSEGVRVARVLPLNSKTAVLPHLTSDLEDCSLLGVRPTNVVWEKEDPAIYVRDHEALTRQITLVDSIYSTKVDY